MTTGRVPQLAVPFALLAAVAADASVRFFSSPLVGIADELDRRTGVLLAAGNWGLIGFLLTRAARSEAADDRPLGGLGLRLVGWIAFGSAAVGAVLGGGSVSGVGWGGVCGLVAAPLCAAVLRASVRARRARHGSLVAKVDARSAWGALAAATALASLPAIVAWPLVRAEGLAPPWLAIGALAAALGFCVFERVAVGAARRRLARVSADLADDARGDDAALPTVDLGVGSERRAKVGGAFSYRAAERATELVVGDEKRAAEALARAARGATLHVALVALALLAHAAAATPRAALEAEARLCAQRRMASCDARAALLGARDEVIEFSRRACTNGVVASCARLVSRDEPATHAAVARALGEACDAGVLEACGPAACRPLRLQHADRMRSRQRAERATPRPQACPALAPGPIPASDGDACPGGMVLVAGGAFTSGWTGVEAHIAPLCVDERKVHAWEWFHCPSEVCGAPIGAERCVAPRMYGMETMNCVTHAQAERYCAWRGARLPTVEEWEWISHPGFPDVPYSWTEVPPDPEDCWSGVCSAFPAKTTAEGVTRAGNVWTSTVDDKQTGRFAYAGGSLRSMATPRARSIQWAPDIGVQCVESW